MNAQDISQRMQAIAYRLGELIHNRVGMEINLSDLKASADNLRAVLTPPEGWGKNPDDRKTNSQKAYDAHPELSKLVIRITQVEHNLLRCKADIEALIEERRSLEWTISAIQAEAMQGQRQDYEHRRQNIIQQRADYAIQETMDNAMNGIGSLGPSDDLSGNGQSDNKAWFEIDEELPF